MPACARRGEVVVIAADDYYRHQAGVTGQELVDALAASPFRSLDLEPARAVLPVRGVRR